MVAAAYSPATRSRAASIIADSNFHLARRLFGTSCATSIRARRLSGGGEPQCELSAILRLRRPSHSGAVEAEARPHRGPRADHSRRSPRQPAPDPSPRRRSQANAPSPRPPASDNESHRTYPHHSGLRSKSRPSASGQHLPWWNRAAAPPLVHSWCDEDFEQCSLPLGPACPPRR